MTPRQRARRLHFVVMGMLGVVPLAFAIFLILGGAKSGSTYSGIASAIGLLVLAAVVLYGLVSSAIVWLVAGSPRHMLLVHALALGCVAAASAFWV